METQRPVRILGWGIEQGAVIGKRDIVEIAVIVVRVEGAPAAVAALQSGGPFAAALDRGLESHAEIAHADLENVELVKIGDKGVGLDNVGPSGPGRLETSVQVLERLFHLRPHVAFAHAVAVDIAGQLAGGVDDLAAAAHRHDVRVGGLSVRHSDIHAFRLKPLDL